MRLLWEGCYRTYSTTYTSLGFNMLEVKACNDRRQINCVVHKIKQIGNGREANLGEI